MLQTGPVALLEPSYSSAQKTFFTALRKLMMRLRRRPLSGTAHKHLILGRKANEKS